MRSRMFGPASTLGAATAATVTIGALAGNAVQWRVEDGGNGHWYAFKEWGQPKPWNAARSAVLAEGGDLACINSLGEQLFLVSIAPAYMDESGGQAWLGGYQDLTAADFQEPHGGWRWVSGEPMVFTGWMNSGTGWGADFMTLAKDVNGNFGWNDLWTDYFGGRRFAFVEWSADCNNDGVVDYGQCRNGSLPDYDGNNVPDCCEVPDGWFVIADSERGFTTTQGTNGWTYLFDNGAGTEVRPIPFIAGTDYQPPTVTWCTRPIWGVGGSFCSLDAFQGHTNTGSLCGAPQAGLERPRRRWTSLVPFTGRLLLSGYFGTNGGMTARIQVLVDHQPVYECASPSTALWFTPLGAVIDVTAASTIEVVLDPNDGACHSDRVAHVIRMLSPDCTNDGFADYEQILQGQLADTNHDGVPDICQQPSCHDADLFANGTVNGADLAILLSQWGVAPSGTVSDINRDGQVNGADLALLLSFWGPCS